MRSSSPADRAVAALLPILALVAEGAWITVAYVSIETTIARQAPLLGTFEFAAIAGIVALAVRGGWLDPDERPLSYLGAVLACGAVGWLWDADARATLATGEVVDAIGLHPGGWLAMVAAMRGTGRAFEVDDRAMSRLVLGGVPALAIPWALGQAAAGDLRPVFTREAFVASLGFVSSGFTAAGLARLAAIGRETGVDWRRERSWLFLIVAVLALVLLFGIPAAFLLGVPVDAVARGLVGPLATLIGYAFLAVAWVAGIILLALVTLLSGLEIRLPVAAPSAPIPGVAGYTFEQLRGPLVSIAIFWALVVLLTIVVARTWLRRRLRRDAARPDEERAIVVPQVSFRLGMPMRRPGRRAHGIPRDAVGAYLAASEELAARRAALAREEAETPRAHARRALAREPDLAPELAWLQADYALARYGARSLSPVEHLRAIDRWRRLRGRLRGR
jgi:hypothetical protein